MKRLSNIIRFEDTPVVIMLAAMLLFLTLGIPFIMRG